MTGMVIYLALYGRSCLPRCRKPRCNITARLAFSDLVLKQRYRVDTRWLLQYC